MLYIILRHRNDPAGTWHNTWDNDRVVTSITTNEELATLCDIEKKKNNRAAIYRCAYSNSPATICCVVEIDRVTVDPKTSFVTFKSGKILEGITPPRPAIVKENFYFVTDVTKKSVAA